MGSAQQSTNWECGLQQFSRTTEDFGHCWALLGTAKKMLNVRLLVWPRTMMIKQSLCPVLFKGAFDFTAVVKKKLFFSPIKSGLPPTYWGAPTSYSTNWLVPKVYIYINISQLEVVPTRSKLVSWVLASAEHLGNQLPSGSAESSRRHEPVWGSTLSAGIFACPGPDPITHNR